MLQPGKGRISEATDMTMLAVFQQSVSVPRRANRATPRCVLEQDVWIFLNCRFILPAHSWSRIHGSQNLKPIFYGCLSSNAQTQTNTTHHYFLNHRSEAQVALHNVSRISRLFVTLYLTIFGFGMHYVSQLTKQCTPQTLEYYATCVHHPLGMRWPRSEPYDFDML